MMAIEGTVTNHGTGPKTTATIGLVHNNINVAATISLSATGSKNAPNSEPNLIFRAIYPSSQSVMAAAMKILVVAVLPHQQST
jgi:hypothetical protein